MNSNLILKIFIYFLLLKTNIIIISDILISKYVGFVGLIIDILFIKVLNCCYSKLDWTTYL